VKVARSVASLPEVPYILGWILCVQYTCFR